MGFSYAQICQENGFYKPFVAENLRNQIELPITHYPDVQFEKMSDTGKIFNETFGYVTPPIVDTLLWKGNNGLIIDENGSNITVNKETENTLCTSWEDGDRKIVFAEDKITAEGISEIVLDISNATADIKISDNMICYVYKGNSYYMIIDGADLITDGERIKIVASSDVIFITLSRNKEA